MQSTAALLLAALASLTVTTGRKLAMESEANLRTHPNSIYSMMDQHSSTKEKSRGKSKYKEGVKVFYQTGVSKSLPVSNSEFYRNMVAGPQVGEWKRISHLGIPCGLRNVHYDENMTICHYVGASLFWLLLSL